MVLSSASSGLRSEPPRATIWVGIISLWKSTIHHGYFSEGFKVLASALRAGGDLNE